MKSVGNHCVVVKGLNKEWKNVHNDAIECLELENYDDSDHTKFIPVDHPFFEEVWVDIQKIFHDFRSNKFDSRSKAAKLNRYGEKLAETKWGKLDTQVKIEKYEISNKYDMVFVRAVHPSYHLKFAS